MEPDVNERASRKRPCHSSYTRRRGQHFLEINDSEASQGPWTKLETCMLQTVESFLNVINNVQVTYENTGKLYNFVASSEQAIELGAHFRPKRVSQIQAKLLSVANTKQGFLNNFSPCL